MRPLNTDHGTLVACCPKCGGARSMMLVQRRARRSPERLYRCAACARLRRRASRRTRARSSKWFAAFKREERAELGTSYVMERLGMREAPTELVELKRLTLQLKRTLWKRESLAL